MPADPDTAPAIRTPDNQTDEGDAIYKQIRAEIRFELELMNARVNWLVASQAFLFVPLTIGAKGGDLIESPFFPLIPMVGLALCGLIFIALLAATWRSHQWRAKSRQGAYSGTDAHGAFSIVAPYTPAIPRMGLIGALGVPIVLAATWSYILIAPPGGS